MNLQEQLFLFYLSLEKTPTADNSILNAKKNCENALKLFNSQISLKEKFNKLASETSDDEGSPNPRPRPK